jgi:hypothetical protein
VDHGESELLRVVELELNKPALAGGRTISVANVALALLPAAMLCVLLLRAIWDVDIFWQLRLGDMILAAGKPILREPFAATHLGEPLPAVAWLGQAVFATARQLGGWTGLRLIDALCWCGGFWLVAAACRARGASAGHVAMGLILAFLAAWSAASVRPQSFGVLCFGALLALLKLELRLLATLCLATPLLVLWQNLHPSVSIAAVALGAHAAGGWAAWLRDRTLMKPWAATILIPIAFASMFATPDGLAVLAVSARNAQASISVGASEWLPLWVPSNYMNAVPVIVVTLLVGRWVWRNGTAVSWPDAATMLVLLVLTVSAYRFVLFWAVAVVPVVATSGMQAGSPRRRLRWIALVAVALVALVTPWLRPTYFSDNLPLAAADRLRATSVRGTIFTEPEFAGVLIDTGYPRWTVSYDGRYYRYTDDEWGRYGQILDGSFGLRAIERLYHPAAFVLRPSHSTALCAQLDRRGSGWRRIWSDEGAAVWVPRR